MIPTYLTGDLVSNFPSMNLSVRSGVWDIPELINLISSWLPRNDCVHLAYTSRLCFSSTIEFVWCDVRGAKNILVMLPETEVSVGCDHLNKRVELVRLSLFSI